MYVVGVSVKESVRSWGAQSLAAQNCMSSMSLGAVRGHLQAGGAPGKGVGDGLPPFGIQLENDGEAG